MVYGRGEYGIVSVLLYAIFLGGLLNITLLSYVLLLGQRHISVQINGGLKMRKILIMATVVIVSAASSSAFADSSIGALANDWRAISGQIDSLVAARDHASPELQSLANQSREDAVARADLEGRLKWVLDNWVSKQADPAKP